MNEPRKTFRARPLTALEAADLDSLPDCIMTRVIKTLEIGGKPKSTDMFTLKRGLGHATESSNAFKSYLEILKTRGEIWNPTLETLSERGVWDDVANRAVTITEAPIDVDWLKKTGADKVMRAMSEQEVDEALGTQANPGKTFGSFVASSAGALSVQAVDKLLARDGALPGVLLARGLSADKRSELLGYLLGMNAWRGEPSKWHSANLSTDHDIQMEVSQAIRFAGQAGLITKAHARRIEELAKKSSYSQVTQDLLTTLIYSKHTDEETLAKIVEERKDYISNAWRRDASKAPHLGQVARRAILHYIPTEDLLSQPDVTDEEIACVIERDTEEPWVTRRAIELKASKLGPVAVGAAARAIKRLMSNELTRQALSKLGTTRLDERIRKELLQSDDWLVMNDLLMDHKEEEFDTLIWKLARVRPERAGKILEARALHGVQIDRKLIGLLAKSDNELEKHSHDEHMRRVFRLTQMAAEQMAARQAADKGSVTGVKQEAAPKPAPSAPALEQKARKP